MRPSTSEFACDVAIEAGAAWVYDVLTTAGGLSLWWGHRIEDDLGVGSAADLVLGGRCVLRIRVYELERPSRGGGASRPESWRRRTSRGPAI